jgi:hypothetical protein
MEPSEGTLKALREQDEEEEDGEDTAKVTGQIRSPQPQPPATPPPLANARERSSSVTQNRLSSMFEGWLRSSSPTPSSPNRNSAIRVTNNRMSISEPRLLEQHTGASLFSDLTGEVSDDEDLDSAFEAMLVCNVVFPRISGC